ncbi:glucose-6-phosphate dehydrogenase [Streptomyces sp. SCSIO 75703]|uniref:glucose-6-phosphate dehydrogenase n=1 Tax=Streptomyces sp. SCSIO 75703 TaxID=3112165 RepID=UPI0030D0B381
MSEEPPATTVHGTGAAEEADGGHKARTAGEPRGSAPDGGGRGGTGPGPAGGARDTEAAGATANGSGESSGDGSGEQPGRAAGKGGRRPPAGTVTPSPPLDWRNPLRDPRDRRLPRIAGPSGLVIFGVTGDLSRKKLMPAVYDLANRGLLPPGFSLVGFARRDWEDQDFAQVVHDAVKENARTTFREEVWQQLAAGMRFVPGDFDDDTAFERLREAVEELDASQGTSGNYAFYLSVPPRFFPKVVQQLKDHGLADAPRGSWRRAVIEKPFGHDLASARELNALVHEVFEPDQVFRIDHYLGKETVQNILALRFANTMFEPIWNRSFVDHVQITMAEDIGIGGRAGYYDGIGAARDVIQNHLLQLLALTAMEEPAAFDAPSLLTEKLKVLRAVRLPDDLGAHTVRGQYEGGWQGGAQVCGYLEEEGIDAASTTDTYAAVGLAIDNRRWAGVPFYLRTGKRLGRRVTEIAVVFQRAPHSPFDTSATEELGENAIVIRVQPDEGMTVRFGSKVPGTSMEIRDVSMDFAYGESFTESSPEAYERLILDVLLGDANLFPRHQEVEESWRILDPVEEYWAAHGRPARYASGSWGPREADEMLARDGRSWRRP